MTDWLAGLRIDRVENSVSVLIVHFVHRQDAVAVLVVPAGDRLGPDAADRIAGDGPVRDADLRRRRAEAHDLVRVDRRVEVEVEAELLAVDELAAERDFEARRS